MKKPMLRLLLPWLALLASTVAVAAQVVPTPEQAMSFNIARDARAWTIARNDASAEGFITDLLLEGETLAAWTERVEQSVNFTDQPVADYVEQWQRDVQQAHPELALTPARLEDGSISVICDGGGQLAMYRFIQGRDGIYALAYAVRRDHVDPSRWKRWVAVLLKAHLVDNPAAGEHGQA